MHGIGSFPGYRRGKMYDWPEISVADREMILLGLLTSKEGPYEALLLVFLVLNVLEAFF